MGRMICHHDGIFFEWSTVCDAPVTYGMTREAFERYYRDEYGRRDFENEFPQRVARALKKGTSGHSRSSLMDLLEFNDSAGNDGPTTIEELWEEIGMNEPQYDPAHPEH